MVIFREKKQETHTLRRKIEKKGKKWRGTIGDMTLFVKYTTCEQSNWNKHTKLEYGNKILLLGKYEKKKTKLKLEENTRKHLNNCSRREAERKKITSTKVKQTSE